MQTEDTKESLTQANLAHQFQDGESISRKTLTQMRICTTFMALGEWHLRWQKFTSPPLLQTQTEVLQGYKRHVYTISNLTAGYLYAFLEPSSSWHLQECHHCCFSYIPQAAITDVKDYD